MQEQQETTLSDLLPHTYYPHQPHNPFPTSVKQEVFRVVEDQSPTTLNALNTFRHLP
jgi:hypothetical protein